jgi:glycosyltransferase involved in cell wall biosynthesis
MILGGAQENTLFTCEGQHLDSNNEVTLITGPAIGREGELVERAKECGFQVILVDEMRREVNVWLEFLTLRSLTRHLRELKPDVVHTHSTKAGILGRMAAQKARVPVVIHTIHGPPFHPNQIWIKNAFFIALERYAAKKSDKILCVADAMSQQAIDAGVAPADMFVTVRSGMEVEHFRDSSKHREEMRRKLGFAEGEIVVGKIARLAHLKGYEFMIELAQSLCPKYPNLKFMFVGDGALHDSLQRQAQESGIGDRIVFTGLVPATEIPACISAMDILVHTSLREGLARVLPQALISGKPVVSFDIDGAREVCLNEETGFLIPPKDQMALEEGVEKLIADPDLKARLGARGQELFTEAFSKEVMVEQINDIYRQCLALKALRSSQKRLDIPDRRR